MTRRVLLVEIGTPAALPVVTPPAPRPPSSWVPDPRPSPGLPPPTGLAVVSIADAAVLTWTPSVAGGQTIIEAAPDVAGVPGIWREVDRTGADTYTISLPGGPRWVRVRAELNGRTSVATSAVLAEPIPVGDISEFEQELRDLQDLVDAVAAQAAADAAALNARADDLRADLDGEIARALAAESALGDRADGLRADVDDAIAEISTLGDTTEDLATEIARVETESVGRDTATASTIALLGATNGAGTAFILDGNTVRVAPDQSLAQWRASVQGEFASQSSRIDTEVQTLQDADQALATTLAAVQATANNAATKAELTAAQSALASDIAAEASRIGAMEVRMPAGSDKLANEARVVAAENAAATANAATASTLALLGAKNAAGTAFILDGDTVRVAPDQSLAQWRNSIQGEFSSQSSRIDNEAQARQDADQALATTLAAVQATANNAATKAELTSAETALAAANQALSERIDTTQASMALRRVINPDFELGAEGWADSVTGTGPLPAGVTVDSTAGNAFSGTRYVRFHANDGSSRSIFNAARTPIEGGETIHLRMRTRTAGPPPAGAQIRLGIRCYRHDGGFVVRYAPYLTSTGATWLYDSGVVEGPVEAPADAREIQPFIYCIGLTANSIICDAVTVDVQTATAQALAQLIDITRGEVQGNADGISAHATQLAAQSVAIGTAQGTADDAAAVATAAQAAASAAASHAAAVELTVQQQGNTLSSHGQAINGLQATAAGHSASINELREVSASAVSGNAVINPSFETDDGWLLTDSNVYMESANAVTGNRILRIAVGSGHAINLGRAKVRTGQRLRLGGMMNPRGSVPNSGAQLELRVRRYDANGSYIDHTRIARFDRPGNYNWHPFEAPWEVPAGTAEVALQLSTTNHTSGAFAIDDVYLEPVSESLADVLASYVLAMNAGNKVSGLKFLNDGSVSNATFLFDNFDFETADGTFRISDGRTITRSNGYMRVEGKPFGQNNEMVVWYGPEQSNLANCRRNNAISFETNNGLHYSIGAMFSGTISAGGYTTAIAATSYSTGAFGTNGGPIVVNASFTHSRQQLGGKQQSPNWQKNTISPGGGTTSARIELWRRIGTGSWQLVASATREGVLSIQSSPGEPDIDDVAQWNNTVSLTYTDNAGGTQNREFEVRLIQNTFQGIVISGDAPVPAPTDSRSLGVRTSE